jgi:hypothetical protein
MRSRGDHFKPIQAEFRLTAEAACDYTKRPEVTLPTGSSLEKVPGRRCLERAETGGTPR